jgi:hypothetical protein
MPPVRKPDLNDIRRQVFSLDEDGLWALVRLLFPDAAEETLEDLYDALLSAARRDGERIPAEDVFAEEDARRGISR